MLKLSSLLLVFFAISVQADPWIQEEGEWNFRLEHVINKFDTIRVFDDSKAEIGTIKGNTTSLSISYGLMKDLELGVRGSYISSNRENDGDNRNNTLSDAAISLKYRLLNEFENSPFTLSLGAEYQSPLRSYEAHKLYSGGDGQNDLAFSISVGKFIELNEEWALFASGDLGYNFRFQGSPDEINLAASVGLTYRDWSFYNVIDKTDARDCIGI
ncbi:MAG: hypothetical protein HRT88_07035, partial [Lentisphaeraceae bacterium]|nr:hypothetical protein [Lentisphaeraceae bacterium]